MNGEIFICTLFALIWLRPPLSAAGRACGEIAVELRRLREMAERGRQ